MSHLKMFGTTTELLDEAIEEAIDPLMLAMQMMSDAQELMVREEKELARQVINRAKYVVNKVRMAGRVSA